MIKRVGGLLSSYINGEFKKPERIKKQLEESNKLREIHNDMIMSREIEGLEYRQCALRFEDIGKKRIPRLLPVIVSASAVLISFLILYPLFRQLLSEPKAHSESFYDKVNE